MFIQNAETEQVCRNNPLEASKNILPSCKATCSVYISGFFKNLESENIGSSIINFSANLGILKPSTDGCSKNAHCDWQTFLRLMAKIGTM